ncbi:hypothetical protein HDU85_002825 [Gaertneriomyces sp. JEL0708]|nr:hypothetical protein HDU85_002825 [Gaertneriomyces sp. JEL0708]
MPPKRGKGKKGASAKDAWNSDDDKKFDVDLKRSPSPAENEVVEDKEEEISIPQPSHKKKNNKKKTSTQQVQNAFDLLDAETAAKDDSDEGGLADEDEEEETKVTRKSKAKKSKRRGKGGDSDDDSDAPRSKASAQNAFDLLNEDNDDQGEDDDEDEAVQNLGGKFGALDLDADHEETGSKDKKKRASKKSKSAEHSDDEQANQTKERKPKRSREERKKEKADKKKDLRKKKDVEAESDEDAPVDQDRLSIPGAYGYASGQSLGPEGTNPADAIAVTGNLLSPPNSRDLHVDKLTVQAFGKLLIKDSELTLINGKRYGLIAPNGSGKSTLLHAIACGLVPMPRVLDYYLLDREFGPTEMTSLEAVLEINHREYQHLMDEMENLLDNPDKNAVRLDYIQTRLAELEAAGADRRALDILKGLGFSDELIQTKTKDLSGGWRMRISLARILFVKPTLMLLDEPTNHLDLEAVVWLEEYLLHNLEGHTLVMTSHSQDTLNEVCTDIIHLYHQHLDFYAGNYNTFTKVRAEKDALLNKRARAQAKQMDKLKENLSKTGSKAQTQAKNRVKAMEKRQEKDKEKNKALEEELIWDKPLTLRFSECGRGLPPPVLKFSDVDFAYPGGERLFHNLNFGIDLDSRIALVGPNGAGKSTLMKLMQGELQATSGQVTRNHHLRIAQFHQHMGDQLDMNQSAVQWLCAQFPQYRDQEMRREVGKYGLTGKSQVIPMRQLSDGQRRRVIFAYLGLKTPHLFLMDEPTNALDLETIDALAEAINDYDGGVVFITHDFRLIDQVAKEVWIVRDGEVEEFDGDIRDYKMMLKQKYADEREAAEAAANATA